MDSRDGTGEIRTGQRGSVNGVHAGLVLFGLLLFGAGVVLSLGAGGIADSSLPFVGDDDDSIPENGVDPPDDESDDSGENGDTSDDGSVNGEDGDAGDDSGGNGDSNGQNGDSNGQNGNGDGNGNGDDTNGNGADGDGDGDEPSHTLEIEATGSEAVVYELTVDGVIEPADEQTESESAVDESAASGELESGSHTYAVDGDIEFQRLDGEANVYLESELVHSNEADDADDDSDNDSANGSDNDSSDNDSNETDSDDEF